MEHLLNCHGEWAAVLALAANVPVLGAMFIAFVGRGGKA